METQFLKAGKESSWSLLRSGVSLTWTSGTLFGRTNVDIVALMMVRFVNEACRR